jgi:hypothetical protein
MSLHHRNRRSSRADASSESSDGDAFGSLETSRRGEPAAGIPMTLVLVDLGVTQPPPCVISKSLESMSLAVEITSDDA